MKIQTYDSNGMIISSNEVEGKVPEYIKVFDDSMFVFNISESDYKLIKSKLLKSERNYLIEKYKWLIKYDFELYCNSRECADIGKQLSCNFVGTPIKDIFPDSVNDILLKYRDNWSVALLNYSFVKAKQFYRSKGHLNTYIWMKFITSERNISWTNFRKQFYDSNEFDYNDFAKIRYDRDAYCYGVSSFKSFLSTVNSVRRASKYKDDSITSILSVLPTYYNSLPTPIDLEKDDVVTKIIECLYLKGGKERKNLYNIISAYNFYCDRIETTSSVNCYIRRMISPEYVFVFDDKDRSIKITLAKEEFASMLVGVHNDDANIEVIKKVFQKEYDEYSSKERSYIEEQINGQIYNEFGITLNDGNIKKWKEFYRNTRKEFETGSRISELPKPSYYYNLLFAIHDNPCNEFEFSDRFITDLLFICNQLHGVRINEIFDNVYCLNYIKKKISGDTSINDPFVVYPEGIESNTIDELYNRIIDFLTPILHNKKFVQKNWLKGEGRYDFKTKFKDLLELKNDDNSSHVWYLREVLIKNIPFKNENRPGFIQGFNIKLLCNIIGALSSEEGRCLRVFCANTAQPIITELCVKRNIGGNGSYKNYILRYKQFHTSDTLFKNIEIVHYIQTVFKVAKSD